MISRRKFLVVGAGLTAAAAAGGYIARPHLSRLLRPELDLTYPVGVLSEAEARTIVALGETLAAPQSMPPADFFGQFVDELTRTQKGYLKEFQRGAALLNAAAGQKASGRRFAELEVAARDSVLRVLLWQFSAGDRFVRKLEVLTAPHVALALRQYVMAPLIRHYYRSEYGWRLVGYDTHPGQERNVVDYAVLPAAVGAHP
jgi:hypothetical protein